MIFHLNINNNYLPELCSPLPKSQTSHIKICENTQQYAIDFLQNLLPPSDRKSIPDELRKVHSIQQDEQKSIFTKYCNFTD